MNYAPGSVVDIIGKDQQVFFGERLIAIMDPAMIRTLEANAHPYLVLKSFRWGRRDYVKGELLWAVTRSLLKDLPAGAVRPATGAE